MLTRHRGHQGRAARAPRRASRRRASWWRRSASSSAPASTWRCCRRWATARASRTTRATSSGARRASRRRRWSTTCRDDALMFVDESHVHDRRRSAACTTATARARQRWSDYGFRLPSALDNRPLQVRGVRAQDAPGGVRLGHAGRLRAAARAAQVVEQVVRPTGLVDPRGRGAPGRTPGRRPAAGDPRARGGAASACWSPR
jgi:hypothetical protein